MNKCFITAVIAPSNNESVCIGNLKCPVLRAVTCDSGGETLEINIMLPPALTGKRLSKLHTSEIIVFEGNILELPKDHMVYTPVDFRIRSDKKCRCVAGSDISSQISLVRKMTKDSPNLCIISGKIINCFDKGGEIMTKAPEFIRGNIRKEFSFYLNYDEDPVPGDKIVFLGEPQKNGLTGKIYSEMPRKKEEK